MYRQILIQDHVVIWTCQYPWIITWIKEEFNYFLVFILNIVFYAILLSQAQVILHITSLVNTLCYKPRWFDSLYYERCLVIWSQAQVIIYITRFVIWCVFRYHLYNDTSCLKFRKVYCVYLCLVISIDVARYVSITYLIKLRGSVNSL